MNHQGDQNCPPPVDGILCDMITEEEHKCSVPETYLEPKIF